MPMHLYQHVDKADMIALNAHNDPLLVEIEYRLDFSNMSMLLIHMICCGMVCCDAAAGDHWDTVDVKVTLRGSEKLSLVRTNREKLIVLKNALTIPLNCGKLIAQLLNVIP